MKLTVNDMEYLKWFGFREEEAPLLEEKVDQIEYRVNGHAATRYDAAKQLGNHRFLASLYQALYKGEQVFLANSGACVEFITHTPATNT